MEYHDQQSDRNWIPFCSTLREVDDGWTLLDILVVSFLAVCKKNNVYISRNGYISISYYIILFVISRKLIKRDDLPDACFLLFSITMAAKRIAAMNG